jgi:hypothetical protein
MGPFCSAARDWIDLTRVGSSRRKADNRVLSADTSMDALPLGRRPAGTSGPTTTRYKYGARRHQTLQTTSHRTCARAFVYFLAFLDTSLLN